MPNSRYSELAKSKGFPAATSTKQGDEGKPSKTKGDVYGLKGNKDPGGDMPMVMKVRQYGNPGGFKEQPRDRSWGMRSADGYAQCEGMGGYDEDESNETYVKR